MVSAHLVGDVFIGLYPLLADNSCNFLVADFDGPAAMLDALAYTKAARAGDPTLSARAVGCAMATLPGWLAATRFPLACFGYIAALILVAAIADAHHSRHRYAGIRAGLTGGVLAGVTVLAVNITTGILDMPRLLHSATYHAEYLHSSQHDPAAYVIGHASAAAPHSCSPASQPARCSD